MASRGKRDFLVGQPVLVVVDIQGGDGSHKGESPIPHMADYAERVAPAAGLIQCARDCDVPVVFIQEAHRPDHVDFGRELDGAEDVHLVEGHPATEISTRIGFRPDDYFIRKRRYSCFFGTDFELLMKGLGADTLFFIGGLTDVCVHYSFVDGHQHNYYCRVVEDCVAGSSIDAHEASLRAMEYLQAGARCTVSDVKAAFDRYAAGRRKLVSEA